MFVARRLREIGKTPQRAVGPHVPSATSETITDVMTGRESAWDFAAATASWIRRTALTRPASSMTPAGAWKNTITGNTREAGSLPPAKK